MRNIALERDTFKKLLATYQPFGISPAPHFLRIEQVLTNDKSRYTFNFKQDNSDSRTESKLDKNDKFCVTGLALLLLRENTNQVGGQALQSFPNAQVFVAVANEFVPADLEAIYNGFLSLKTGSQINIDKLPALGFRKVPRTQAQALAGGFVYNEFNLDDVLYVGAEDITLDGGKTQTFEFELPTFANMKIASGATNLALGINHKLVLFATGYILKGAGDKNITIPAAKPVASKKR